MRAEMSEKMNLELLQKLVSVPGVSGFERDVANMVKNELGKYMDTVKIDRMGNVISKKAGTNPKAPIVMVVAHTDEVGLMVKYIENNGFLRFEKVGDLTDRQFPGLKVIVHTRNGLLPGVVGVGAAHLTGIGWGGVERLSSPPVRDQFIDIGASSREEAEEMGVSVGSPIAYSSDFTRLGDKFVCGKAFDDRVGLYIMIEAMRRLKGMKHEATICAVGAVEEEPGCRGVRTAAFQLEPDAAIGLDGACAGDYPGMELRDAPIELGRGPAIKIMDVDVPHSGMISHSKIRELLINTAVKNKIPYQLEVFGKGVTSDVSYIQWTGSGIPSCVISFPLRYAHSPFEVVNLDDLRNSVLLLTSSLASLTSKFKLD